MATTKELKQSWMKGYDVVIGEGDLQHQELILVCQKGEFKESPLATVGVANFLRDDDIPGMLHEIRTRFSVDGMEVLKINYIEHNGSLDYEAYYPNR